MAQGQGCWAEAPSPSQLPLVLTAGRPVPHAEGVLCSFGSLPGRWVHSPGVLGAEALVAAPPQWQTFEEHCQLAPLLEAVLSAGTGGAPPPLVALTNTTALAPAPGMRPFATVTDCCCGTVRLPWSRVGAPA